MPSLLSFLMAYMEAIYHIFRAYWPWNRPFRLLELPTELLDHVCSFLPDEDLLNSRQACRTLRGSCAETFGKRFFHNLTIHVYPPLGVDRVLGFAQSRELSKNICWLIFDTPHLDILEERSGGFLDASRWGNAAHLLESSVDKTITTWKSTQENALTEMVRACENLEYIFIDRRALVVFLLQQDNIYSFEEIQFYAAETGQAELQSQSPFPWAYLADLNSRQLLQVLAKVPSNSNIKVCLFFDDSVQPAPEHYALHSTQAAWHNLMGEGLEDSDYAVVQFVTSLTFWEHGESSWVRNMLEHAKNLEHLFIRGGRGLMYWSLVTAEHGFFRWPQLSSLSLCYVQVSTEALRQVIRQCSGTLRALQCSSIFVRDGQSWLPLFQTLHDELKLQHVRFFALSDASLEAPTDNSFDRYMDAGPGKCGPNLRTGTEDASSRALSALVDDYRVIPLMPFEQWQRIVDLRKAVATVGHYDQRTGEVLMP